MLILKDTLHYLLEIVPDAPPETGGIVGGTDGTISCLWLDKCGQNDMYIPDVKKMNHILLGWKKTGIELYGIFHTHTTNNKSLSLADKRYIKNIMLSMPPQVSKLYFPLVFPKKCVVPYYAIIKKASVFIVRDTIEII